MKKDPLFPLEAGLEVQKEQLAAWKSVLKRKKFAKLKKYCKTKNGELSTATDNGYLGYLVLRGTQIDNWVFNNLMKK